MKTQTGANESPETQGKWYSRPLWGNQTFLQWLNNLFFLSRKEEIPQTTVELYKHSYNQLKNISAIARTIDKEKFTSREFVNFLMLTRDFEKDTGNYEGLKYSIELLRVALETKESFLKIEATETRYRSFAQQEFYEYVFDLLMRKEIEVKEFQELVQRELSNVIPKVKSDEGRVAIQSYVNQLDIVCKNQLGLKLLYLFKQYDLSNFSLLRTVADIADGFYDKNLDSLKEFMVVVQVNSEIFLKLGQIIQIPLQKNTPETYALILQYIALRNRHQNSYSQFQQLTNLLKEWEAIYIPLTTIIKEYPPKEYKQPDIFKQDIPGLELYTKYEQHI